MHVIRILAIGMVLSILAGCGATFVKKDIAPEVVNTKRYGVMFTNLFYNGQKVPADPRISFVSVMQKEAADLLKKKIRGPPVLSVVNIFETGDFAPVAAKIAELAPPGMRDKRMDLDPGNDFGDMSAAFKKNDIDVLLLVEMNAWGQQVSLERVLGELAVGFALKATTGAVFGGGSPTTVAKVVAIDASGKPIFTDWKVFTGGLLASKGAITSPSAATSMADTMIDDYLDHVVKQ